MELKKIYIKKLETIGFDTTKLYINDYSKSSVVSFSTKKNGEIFNIRMVFYKKDYDYEIVVRKKVNVIDRMTALEKINDYNMLHDQMSFFLENDDIYGVRSFELYEGDPQSFLDNITNTLNILASNNI